MSSPTLVRDLIEAGIHFGHRASRWNPKMKPFIFGKRNLIHIINVKETLKGLIRAKRFLSKIVSEGKDVLFVGTKRQAQASVQAVAERTGMHYCIERWLGGTLTNFRTIRSRLNRLEELEEQENANFPLAGSKKAESMMKRELNKIRRNLNGLRKMDRPPGCLVIVDPKREHIAAKEARKLGIPIVSLIDTDSDPDMVDIAIPGNDDAMRAVEMILNELAEAVEEGKASRPVREEQPRPPRQERQRGRGPMGRGGARASDAGESGDRGERGSDRAGSDRAGERGGRGRARPSEELDKPDMDAAGIAATLGISVPPVPSTDTVATPAPAAANETTTPSS